MSKNIFIVEDEAIIAAEIMGILDSLGYSVVGQAKNGDKALDQLKSKAIDLVLLDITIQGSLDGIELAKIIKENYNFPYVYLTSHADFGTLEKVKETVPYGYIVKPFTEKDLRSAIELALFRYQSEHQPSFPDKEKIEKKLNVQLTKREYQLFQLLHEGKSYKEMAELNCISVNTVKHHLKHLFQKLGIKSRYEAVRLIQAI